MIFTRLSIENIGLFHGSHQFHLVGSRGNGQNIVAVAGRNGAGKTTLFRAIPLAIHGRLAVGDRIALREYESYLHDLFSRVASGDGVRISKHAQIEVEIETVRSGVPSSLRVARAFARSGQSVTESLKIYENGVRVKTHDPEAWLQDVIPPNVVPLSFFDAEELARMVGSASQASALERSLLRLLGIHLVERLESDLYQFLVKRHVPESEALKARLLGEQSKLDETREAVEANLERLREVALDKRAIKTELAELERRLAAEGGGYARMRPAKQKVLEELDGSIERLEEHLRKAAEGLLPFAFAPRLLATLEKRLAVEDELRKELILERALRERIGMIANEITSETLWEDLPELSAEVRTTVVERVTSLLGGLMASDRQGACNEPTRHDVSSSELSQLRGWIASVKLSRSEWRTMTRELDDLRWQRKETELDLHRAPSDEAVLPLHEEIERRSTRLSELEERERVLLEDKGVLERDLRDHERSYDRARKEFEAAQAGSRGADLAVRSRSVARVYRDALVRTKLGELEKSLVDAFNEVCRKDHLLSEATVDPETFHVSLRGRAGHVIDLDDLSAGERQLYNLSLYRSLRQVSGFDLPLFVDTPFARLDEAHRTTLLKKFFPYVSSQVVLFATDAEYAVLGQPEPAAGLARSYWLQDLDGNDGVKVSETAHAGDRERLLA